MPCPHCGEDHAEQVKLRIRQNGLDEETELLALLVIEARRELELL